MYKVSHILSTPQECKLKLHICYVAVEIIAYILLGSCGHLLSRSANESHLVTIEVMELTLIVTSGTGR